METILVVACLLYCINDYNHEVDQDAEIKALKQEVVNSQADYLIWENQYGKGIKRIDKSKVE